MQDDFIVQVDLTKDLEKVSAECQDEMLKANRELLLAQLFCARMAFDFRENLGLVSFTI